MGCTRTPNPVSRSSHAIQDLSAGLRPSTARLVSASLVLAMRFPIFASMSQLCIWTSSSQHIDQHMKITLGASVRMSGEIGYERGVEKSLLYGMFVVVSAFVRTRAQVYARDS